MATYEPRSEDAREVIRQLSAIGAIHNLAKAGDEEAKRLDNPPVGEPFDMDAIRAYLLLRAMDGDLAEEPA